MATNRRDAGRWNGPGSNSRGVKVLKAVAEKEKFKLDLRSYDLGADRYLKTGEVCPDSVVEELKKVDAIYLGALGIPKFPREFWSGELS